MEVVNRFNVRAVRGAESDGRVGACSAVSTFTLRLGSINEWMNTPFERRPLCNLARPRLRDVDRRRYIYM
jgi:hypothetical protein